MILTLPLVKLYLFPSINSSIDAPYNDKTNLL